jgi:thiol:disulfide interchange protein DsbD
MVNRLRARAVRATLWLLLFAASLTAYAGNDAPPAAARPQFSQVSAASGPLDAVGKWLAGRSSEPELLPPDQAFQLSVRAKDADTLVATLSPAEDYYLYRDRIKFNIEAPPGLTVGSASLPPGDLKDDPTFGKTEVYHRPVEAVIHLSPSGARAQSVRLHASFQGCNEPRGVCYPPIEKTLTVVLQSTDTASAQRSADGGPGTASVASGLRTTIQDDTSEAGRILRLFSRGGAWTLVAAFFGFGVLLAFTPCMLPMIPILSGIIVGRGRHVTKRYAVGLSAVYVLGMAVTYTAAGVAAGLAGSLLSAYLQSPWALGAFAAIFVLLALSMFGLYELQLPSSLQSALARVSGRVPGGHATGVFLMGALSAVIVGPCVAAPLAGALLYISQTRDAVLGGAALFSMAIGMGIPLLVVGATAGTLVRRAGPWTESVERLFGVAMLAVAIYLVSPVISLAIQQLLWAALLIVSAMFVHAFDPLPHDAPGHRRLFKGIGVIALVIGIALLIGVLSGNHNLLQPLAGIRGLPAQGRSELVFQPVESVADLNARLQSVRGRYVMLDFWAEWCVSCKEMDRITFSDPQVQTRLKDVLVLRADVTANSADDQALLRRFALFGPPGIVFFDKVGEEVAYRVIGFEPPEQFLASLDRAFAPRQVSRNESNRP